MTSTRAGSAGTALLAPLPVGYPATREDLKRVAVHILARRRADATGRFGLRVGATGIATPAFGEDVEVVRTSGALLVHERSGRASIAPMTTLAAAAAHVGVDLDAPFAVGHDIPALGDRSAPLCLHAQSVAAIEAWFRMIGAALDGFASTLAVDAQPTLAQLWPEHFDLACDMTWGPDEGQRFNVGGSPGDGFDPSPYAYVGPWGAERPGDTDYWNAPFGAVLRYEQLVGAHDPVAEIVAFYRTGLGLMTAT